MCIILIDCRLLRVFRGLSYLELFSETDGCFVWETNPRFKTVRPIDPGTKGYFHICKCKPSASTGRKNFTLFHLTARLHTFVCRITGRASQPEQAAQGVMFLRLSSPNRNSKYREISMLNRDTTTTQVVPGVGHYILHRLHLSLSANGIV